MIDVSPKFNSLRYALAEGFLYGRQKTLKRVFDKSGISRQTELAILLSRLALG